MNRCQTLDDYLNGDMSDVECDRFEAHLPACYSCSQEIQSNRAMRNLLSTANLDLTQIPSGLDQRIRVRIRRSRVVRFAGAITGAAASVALAIWLFAQSSKTEPTVQISSPHAAAQSDATVRVTFPDSDVLTIRSEFDSKGVTFLWVYQNQRVESSLDVPGRDQ